MVGVEPEEEEASLGVVMYWGEWATVRSAAFKKMSFYITTRGLLTFGGPAANMGAMGAMGATGFLWAGGAR